jgi:hypothetical protein
MRGDPQREFEFHFPLANRIVGKTQEKDGFSGELLEA